MPGGRAAKVLHCPRGVAPAGELDRFDLLADLQPPPIAWLAVLPGGAIESDQVRGLRSTSLSDGQVERTAVRSQVHRPRVPFRVRHLRVVGAVGHRQAGNVQGVNVERRVKRDRGDADLHRIMPILHLPVRPGCRAHAKPLGGLVRPKKLGVAALRCVCAKLVCVVLVPIDAWAGGDLCIQRHRVAALARLVHHKGH